MRKVSRIVSVLLCVTLAVLCSGCWDKRDINERAYVLGIGIDRADGGLWRFSFCCYLPAQAVASATGDKLSAAVVCIESDSMAMAVRQLDRSTSRETVLEQLACIAVGEHTDGGDLRRLLEYPLRQPQVRRQCVVVAAEGGAERLMRAQPDEGAAPVAVASLLEQQESTRRHSSTSALYRVGCLLGEGCDFMLWRVGLSPSSSPLSSPTDAPAGDGGDVLRIAGADVYFCGEYSGSLDSSQAELSRLFTDRRSGGMISVTDGGATDYYEIRRSDCAVRFDASGSQPSCAVTLSLECAPVDPHGAARSPRDIEAAVREQLGGLIDLSLERLGSAPIGAQTAARQQQWKWFRASRGAWRDTYPQCAVSLTVSCRLDSGSARSTLRK